MWQYLKINFLVMGASLIVFLGIFLLLPKDTSNEFLIFIVISLGGVAIFCFAASIWATISDIWRVEVKGEEVRDLRDKKTPRRHKLLKLLNNQHHRGNQKLGKNWQKRIVQKMQKNNLLQLNRLNQ